MSSSTSQTAVASTEEYQGVAKELKAAWLKVGVDKKLGPNQGAFPFTIEQVDIPVVDAPGELGADAVSMITETFMIARGFDPQDYKSKLACAMSLSSFLADATPSMSLLRMDPDEPDDLDDGMVDPYDGSLYRGLCHPNYPTGPWHATSTLTGPNNNLSVVLTDTTPLPDGSVIRRSEHLAILRLLQWYASNLGSRDDANTKDALLSICATRARVLRFSRRGHAVKVGITQWLDLKDPAGVSTLHRALIHDWPEREGWWTRLGNWILEQDG